MKTTVRGPPKPKTAPARCGDRIGGDDLAVAAMVRATPNQNRTFNINNVNKRHPNLLDWLQAAKPDLVCLPELKTADKKLPKTVQETRSLGGDDERIAVAPIAELELALRVGAPQIVGPSPGDRDVSEGCGVCRAGHAMAIENRMDSAASGTSDIVRSRRTSSSLILRAPLRSAYCGPRAAGSDEASDLAQGQGWGRPSRTHFGCLH
jgi:hypothetical protein